MVKQTRRPYPVPPRRGWRAGCAGRVAGVAAACLAFLGACSVAPPRLPPGSYLAQTRAPFLDVGTLGRVGFMEATLDGHGCIRPAANSVGMARALSDMLAPHLRNPSILPLPGNAAVGSACVTPAEAMAGQGVDALVTVAEQVGPAQVTTLTRYGASTQALKGVTGVTLLAVVARSNGVLAWRGAITAVASPDRQVDPATLAGPYDINPAPVRKLALAGLAERLGLEVTELPRLAPTS